MAEHSFPFDTGTVDESTWSRMARVWGGTGIIGYPGDNVAQVYGDSSGMQVKIRAGQAQVRGHHWYSDAEITKVIAANPSGNPRIDRVVLWLDPAANSVTVAVITGTPGATPSPPALTQTDTGNYAFPLAQVYVANGAATISAGNVTEERTYIPDRGVPTGTLAAFAGSAAPAGYLMADGSAVSRATYAQLFAVVGTSFGAGDGSSTFNLPNLKGRAAVGRDVAQVEFDALGETGGAKTHTLTTPEMPNHTHAQNAHEHLFGTETGAAISGSGKQYLINVGGGTSANAGATATNQHTGGGQAHNNLQPYLVTNFIVKT